MLRNCARRLAGRGANTTKVTRQCYGQRRCDYIAVGAKTNSIFLFLEAKLLQRGFPWSRSDVERRVPLILGYERPMLTGHISASTRRRNGRVGRRSCATPRRPAASSTCGCRRLDAARETVPATISYKFVRWRATLSSRLSSGADVRGARGTEPATARDGPPAEKNPGGSPAAAIDILRKSTAPSSDSSALQLPMLLVTWPGWIW